MTLSRLLFVVTKTTIMTIVVTTLMANDEQRTTKYRFCLDNDIRVWCGIRRSHCAVVHTVVLRQHAAINILDRSKRVT